MSVETIRARLGVICAGITGVNHAYTALPRNIAGANLPAVVIQAGEAAYSHQSDDLLWTVRQYRLVLLVKAWSEGIEGEADDLCEPFFQRFADTFTIRPSLNTTTNTDPLATVQMSELTSDSGVINIVMAGIGYAGVIFTLEVTSADIMTRHL